MSHALPTLSDYLVQSGDRLVYAWATAPRVPTFHTWQTLGASGEPTHEAATLEELIEQLEDSLHTQSLATLTEARGAA